ncbi:MAG: peptidylprolyl isomerase [Deltaproteobacteria bacterium]
MKRILFPLFIAVPLFVSPPCPVRSAIVDRVVAIVNDEPITLSELEDKARPVLQKYMGDDGTEEKKKEILAQILPQVIDEYLVQAEVKRRGIVVGDDEIDAAIERICADNGITRDEFFKRLASEGMTIEKYREGLREQIQRAQLINAEVRAKIVVTDEQVDAYLQKDQTASTPSSDAVYVVEHIGIALPDPSDPVSKNEARKKAEAALDALQSGRSFAEVASQYSDFPSAGDGGLLGSFTAKEMAPFLRDVVTGLAPGKYSGVIETPNGYQIFRLKEVKNAGGGAIAVDAVRREEIRQELYRKSLNARFDEWLSGLRSQSSIRILF